MEVSQILKALERNTGLFPKEAVEAAVEAREAITPELLRILEDTVDRAPELAVEGEDNEYFAHLYALYLLAQFREVRAYPLVVRFARLDDDVLDALAGEFITEDLCRVLASVCGGDTRLIEDLVEDASVGEYVRSAALRSLLVLVAEGAKSRDEVIAYFSSLFEGKLERSPCHIWDTLADCAVRLHPGELIGHIEVAFDEELIDPGFISPRAIEGTRNRDRKAVLAEFHAFELGYIGSVVKEMAGWVCFRQPQRPPRGMAPSPASLGPLVPLDFSPPPRAAKVGPNEPCPCGSGRKYKKCCGRIT
jgi:hypothetical protein